MNRAILKLMTIIGTPDWYQSVGASYEGTMKIILTSPGAGETFPEFKTQYDVSTNPDGTITITTKGPLQPGEYAFAIGAVMEASVRFFGFGIDPQ